MGYPELTICEKGGLCNTTPAKKVLDVLPRMKLKKKRN